MTVYRVTAGLEVCHQANVRLSFQVELTLSSIGVHAGHYSVDTILGIFFISCQAKFILVYFSVSVSVFMNLV